MAFNRVQSTTNNAPHSGATLGIDPTNPVHLAYTGAAVVGATVVAGSVAVTTVAAPGLVLVPGAIVAGLCTYAHIENDRRTTPDDVTESAAA